MTGLDDSGSSVKPRGDGDVKLLERADVKPRVEVQQRTISPYDLSSSDNPGSVISQPLLRGPNYNEWAGMFVWRLKLGRSLILLMVLFQNHMKIQEI
ncbi:hypothetical protein V5N11_000487 [Cardamine amara subsp. amara]|uniref:Retrotransposon Copia-like N-terminal domain-containing protein n=1 Tax=Cardamine amara subsp. amara TaxID=228776 RepID=A0ABD1ALX1_CARAN